MLADKLRRLDKCTEDLDCEIMRGTKDDEAAWRLTTIPGLGPAPIRISHTGLRQVPDRIGSQTQLWTSGNRGLGGDRPECLDPGGVARHLAGWEAFDDPVCRTGRFAKADGHLYR